MTEEHGAVPLPPGEVSVVYDPSNLIGQAQQPQAQQLAVFEAVPNDGCVNGTVIDVNQQFCVYAVKNGLIRVLHRRTAQRSLLRAHEGRVVTDIRFFQSGDVCGTVGGNVIVWRIFERTPEILAEKLLEIPDSLPSVSRLIWHPFNPNQFWLFHKELQQGSTVSTLIDTTRITTVQSGNHALCQMHREDVVMDGAVRVAGANVTDLCWSGKDSKHILTGHDDGAIRLWDTKKTDSIAGAAAGTVSALCKTVVQENEPISRCLFLPHDDHANNLSEGEPALTTCFCTSTNNNGSITVWSPFTETGTPKKLHVFKIDNPTPSYNLNVCYGPIATGNELPPAFFFMLSDRKEGRMYCLSLKSSWSESEPKRPVVEGFDYVVPFQTKFPTFSWSITCGPAENLEESAPTGGLNFDIRFFALQSKMVQQMSVLHYMCLPPTNGWSERTEGVRIDAVIGMSHMDSDQEFDEEYELSDDDEKEDDEDDGGDGYPQMGLAGEGNYQTPDASALPTPMLGSTGGATSDNPFGNWLGALAAKPSNIIPTPVEPMSPPPVPPSTPATVVNTAAPPPGLLGAVPVPGIEQSTGGGFLSPMELLSATKDAVAATSSNTTTSTEKEEIAPAPTPEPNKRNKSPRNNSNSKTHGNKNNNNNNGGGGGKRGNSPKRRGKKGPTPVPGSDGKIAILKREGPAPVSSSDAAPQPIPRSTSSSSSSSVPTTNQYAVKDIQEAVRAEMHNSVIPTLADTVNHSVKQTLSNIVRKSVEDGMNKKSGVATDDVLAAVSSGVAVPVKEAFAESMVTALIPAFESATNQILSQVATSLEKQEVAATQTIAGLSAKVDTLTKLVEVLAGEIRSLKDAPAAPAAPLGPPGLNPPAMPPKDPKVEMQEQIVSLLRQGKFEAAFTNILSARSADMAVFACKNANVRDVLGGDTPALSQPILLCLMQQLGAVLPTASDPDLDIVLVWLQELALTLDPLNGSIQRHVPPVLQQLVASINSKMANASPAYRRPLQMLLQVIRGMTQR